MTGNPKGGLQLAIPIKQRSRRDLTKQQLRLSDGHFARFPVSLRAIVNRCLIFKLWIVLWRGAEDDMLTERWLERLHKSKCLANGMTDESLLTKSDIS